MMFSDLRCANCKSVNLIEDYEGADMTCTKCGSVGCVEKIPYLFSLSELEESLETENDKKHRDMENFAIKEIERNFDLADLLGNLMFVQKRRRACRKQSVLIKTERLKMTRRVCIFRYKPY